MAEANSRVADLEKLVMNLQRQLELKNSSLQALQAGSRAGKGGPQGGCGNRWGGTRGYGTGNSRGATSTSTDDFSNAAGATPGTNTGRRCAAAGSSNCNTACGNVRRRTREGRSGQGTDPRRGRFDAGRAGEKRNQGSRCRRGGKGRTTQTKPPLRPPQPQEEPSFFDDLLNNPLVLVGGAAAIGLGLVAWLLARRRRHVTTKFEDSIGAGTDIRTSTVFGNTGGGVVNTGDNSLVSDFSREGLGNIDTDEVDPIAEAEVYLAYGRDNQAEEILRDALGKTPDRQEIRLKLLEIYAQQNKPTAFETIASEVFAATKGSGDIWAKAAQLGRGIDPANPLYAAKGEEAGAGSTAAAGARAGER